MFLTWQFWNALRFPMWRHPIFIQARKKQISSKQTSRMERLFQLVFFACLVLCFFIFPIPAIVTTLGLILGLPTLMIVFNGTVLGTIWVTMIGLTITRSHQNYHFDLLSLTPQGAYGVSWYLCTGTIHRHNWLRAVYRLLSWVVLLVLVLLGLAALMLIIGLITANDEIVRQAQENVLRDVINIGFIVGALWLDHIQSIVISALLGITLPTIIKDKTQLRSFAPLMYLMMQLLTYLLIYLIYLMMSIILTGIWGASFFVSTTIIGLTLLAFYLLREVIISLLARLIQIQYDTPEHKVLLG